MGNLTERTKQRIVNIAYVLMCIVVVVLVLWFIGAIQACSLHVMEKHTHYHGTELPQEAKAADLIERIFEGDTDDE